MQPFSCVVMPRHHNSISRSLVVVYLFPDFTFRITSYTQDLAVGRVILHCPDHRRRHLGNPGQPVIVRFPQRAADTADDTRHTVRHISQTFHIHFRINILKLLSRHLESKPTFAFHLHTTLHPVRHRYLDTPQPVRQQHQIPYPYVIQHSVRLHDIHSHLHGLIGIPETGTHSTPYACIFSPLRHLYVLWADGTSLRFYHWLHLRLGFIAWRSSAGSSLIGQLVS